MKGNWTRQVLTFFILLCGAAFLSSTTQDPIQQLIGQYQTYLEQRPQEKIYIHSDRSTYSPGEIIWFKSYLVSGPDHVKSELSRTIYVELINEQQEIVYRVKQLVLEGWAAGSFDVTEKVPPGNYTLRAYTNWMRNFDAAYFFYKGITVCGPTKQAVQGSTTVEKREVSFFPEGGDLVEGLASRVGFKAIGTDGLGRHIRGKIMDEQSTTVVSFESNLLGMGSFLFQPIRGKKYYALLEGSAEQTSLPTPKEKGMTLTVTNLPLQKHVSIRIESNFSPDGQSMFLIGQHAGVVNFSAAINLTSKVVSTRIDKSQLPEGITQITLFDQRGQPVSERLIYIEKEQKPLTIEVALDKSTFKPREEISLKIKTKDSENKPVATSLSLAVTDGQQIAYRKDAETIYAYLFLTSELKGHIESPGYYFNPANADRHIALDWLLMTQGWRRFVPAPLAQTLPKLPELVYEVEQGLTIKGKVVNMNTMKPLPNGKVTYLALAPLFDSRTITADETGAFELKNAIYFDSSKVVLQGETKKGNKTTNVILDSAENYPDIHVSNQLYFLNTCLDQLETESSTGVRSGEDFMNLGNAVLLDEFKVTEKKEKDIHENFRTYSGADKTVKVSEKEAIGRLHPLELLRGVSGVSVVRRTFFKWTVLIRGNSSINSGTDPLILVDNVEVTMEILNTIPAKSIESFDVWKGSSAAMFGAQGANGVIAFYTRKGAIEGRDEDKGVYKLKKGGYHAERQFYAPTYGVNDPEHDFWDNRATLYWNPDIQTDSTGVATVKFYNHDRVTTVMGLIEGASTTGKIGTTSFQYQINK